MRKKLLDELDIERGDAMKKCKCLLLFVVVLFFITQSSISMAAEEKSDISIKTSFADSTIDLHYDYTYKFADEEFCCEFPRLYNDCNLEIKIPFVVKRIGYNEFIPWVKIYYEGNLIHDNSGHWSTLNGSVDQGTSNRVYTVHCCNYIPKVGKYTVLYGAGNVRKTTQFYITKSGKCGVNVKYSINKDGKMIVSGKGAIANDSSFTNYITCPWRYDVKELIIKNGITRIGDSAFYECENLQKISIANSVKSIGDQAFGSCSALTSVVLPNKLTKINPYLFVYCSNLKKVTIPVSVKKIGYLAFDCSGISVIYKGSQEMWKNVLINEAFPSDYSVKYGMKNLKTPQITKVKRNKDGTKMTVNWKGQAGVSGYQISFVDGQWYDTDGFYYETTINAPAKSKSKTVNLRYDDYEYYVRIRSYKKIKGAINYSAWSKVKISYPVKTD